MSSFPDILMSLAAALVNDLPGIRVQAQAARGYRNRYLCIIDIPKGGYVIGYITTRCGKTHVEPYHVGTGRYTIIDPADPEWDIKLRAAVVAIRDAN